MAEINLRAYITEIDDLVEKDQLDEAIAHCRHILEIYPKHLATYRLLGKAYLESKRYGDAADIFQRVLSAAPDDFVSHIGMAIVREDEGNLDAAIWHMERAFETNPANPAIQQELRRLIGVRDGLEPHKVRMTRGALARMYAHGELYPQAIAEIRTALQEDADRPDLQVLLATMFWQTDQHDEASAVCKQILEKLPYCQDANRIMASILQASGKSDEAGTYHRRLAALDPYAALVESASEDPLTVNANSIRIDRIDWLASQAMPSIEPTRPDWAASLGAELGGETFEESEPTPRGSWLEDLESQKLEPTSEPAEPSLMPSKDKGAQPFDSDLPSEAEDIPDWMREAGWHEAKDEAIEISPSFSDEELEALESDSPPIEGEPPPDEELAPAEIPGWLQDIAPSGAKPTPIEDISDVEEQDEAQGEAVPGWLDEIAAEVDEVGPEPEAPTEEALPPVAEPGREIKAQEEITGPGEEDTYPVSEGEEVELPTWLEGETDGATSTIVTWLGEKPDKEAEPSGEDLPAEVSEAGAPEAIEPGEEETPSWLAGVAEVASQQDLGAPAEDLTFEEKPQPPEPEEETFDWMQLPAESELEEPSDKPAPPRETPDWLRRITEPEAEIPSSPKAGDRPPEWLQGVAEPESEISPEPAVSSEETPDWLKGIAEPEEEPTSSEEAPDWLQGVEAEKPREAKSAPVSPEPSDRLRESVAEESQEPQPSPEAWGEEEPPVDVEAPIPEGELEPAQILEEKAPPEELPSEMDDDEVFKWLEGLAARQGADEEELIAQPEEPTPEMPAELEERLPTSLVEDKALPEKHEEGMEWLERLAAERGIDTDIGVDLPEEIEDDQATTTPGWLGRMATEPIPKPPGKPESEALEETDEEGFGWLERMATEPLPKIPPELVSEVPGWLEEADVGAEKPTEEIDASAAGIMDEAAEEPEFRPETPEPTLEPEMPEVEEIQPPEPPAPSPEAEPDWLRPPDKPIPPVEPEPEMETPEWLREPEEETPLPTPEAFEPAPTPEAPVEVVPPEPAAEPPIPPPPAEPIAVEPEVEPAMPKPPTVEVPTVPPLEPLPVEPTAEVPIETPPPSVTPVAPAPPPRPPKAAKPDADELLEGARQALASDDIENAVAKYGALTKQKLALETVIEDLRIALERDPNVPSLWQVLGDAYMNNNQLSEAIKAYQRGTEVA
jgi:tetratricopeptide (TPR) repeat protein